MKTTIQELMDEFKNKADSLPDTLDANVAYLAFQECYDMAKSMLEKEQQVMCEFAIDYTMQAKTAYDFHRAKFNNEL